MFEKLEYKVNYDWVDELVNQGATYEEVVDKTLDNLKQHLLLCLTEREKYLEKDNAEKTSDLIQFK